MIREDSLLFLLYDMKKRTSTEGKDVTTEFVNYHLVRVEESEAYHICRVFFFYVERAC
jgi:hypothetical protein